MMTKYQLAGFTDDNGQLGRPVPNGLVEIPRKIWLEGDCLCYKRSGQVSAREPSATMLTEFVRLNDAESVLRFAKEWGVLDLAPIKSLEKKPGGPFYLPGRLSLQGGIEPLEAWLFYAKRAQALLNVAAALKGQKLGDLADWDEFAHVIFDKTVNRPIDTKDQLIRRMRFGLGFCYLSGFGEHFERLEKARNTVSSELQQWLDCWKRDQNEPVSDFTVNWSEAQKRWDLQLDYHGRLFPAIAFQLALVIGQADSLYTCSGCGIPYIRPRTRKRPKTGCANYCGQCNEGKVAQRLAAASYREKQTAIRMFSEGSSVAEIASRIGTDADLVRQWINKGRKNASEKTRK